MRRRTLLRLAAALPWLVIARRPAAAQKPKERYAKLGPMALELWDAGGTFHLVSMDLVLVVVPVEAKPPSKDVVDSIKRALLTVSYEEYVATNPAPIIKSLALEAVRAQPGGEFVTEVLIAKMMFR